MQIPPKLTAWNSSAWVCRRNCINQVGRTFTLVLKWSSTSMRPRLSVFTPTSSRPRPSVNGLRPAHPWRNTPSITAPVIVTFASAPSGAPANAILASDLSSCKPVQSQPSLSLHSSLLRGDILPSHVEPPCRSP